MNEPARINGGELPELNAANAKAYEYAVAVRLDLEQRLGEAHREIGELRQHLAQAAVENEALRSLGNMLESRVAGCVAERDAAVTQRAKCESVIDNLRSILRDYPTPATVGDGNQ
jgi:hypothetical protein